MFGDRFGFLERRRKVGSGELTNPFTPGYGGRVPPLLAGRDSEQEKILLQVMNVMGGGHSARDTFLIGPRGTGKTTLLISLGSTCRRVG